MEEPQNEPRVTAAVWMDSDGEIHQGYPPFDSPDAAERYWRLMDEIKVRDEEAKEHPGRFLAFDVAHETHRRGDASCTQGACEGETQGLPACPLCRSGLVHRSIGLDEPARCDACDASPPDDSVWVGADGAVSVGTPPGMSPGKAAAIRNAVARMVTALEDQVGHPIVED